MKKKNKIFLFNHSIFDKLKKKKSPIVKKKFK